MASQWYLVSKKAPGLRLKIVKMEVGTRRATLVGETGVPFERVITDETLEKFGWTVTRVDETEPVACASS